MIAPSAADRARAAHVRDHLTPALDRLVTAREGRAPCDHANGHCGEPSHQGIGGVADRDWFAARRSR